MTTGDAAERSELLKERYAIIGRLGAGAQGETLEAEDRETGRRVAVALSSEGKVLDAREIVRFSADALDYLRQLAPPKSRAAPEQHSRRARSLRLGSRQRCR